MTEQVSDSPDASGEAQSEEGGNRLERRNAKLANENKELKTQLSQLQTQMKEFEGLQSEKSQAEDKLAKEQGRWEEILAKRDAKISTLEGTLKEHETMISGFKNKEFERRVLDKILPEASADPKIVRGTYLAYLESEGVERFPKDADFDKEVKSRLKGMAEFAPSLFGSDRPTGGTPKPTKETQGGKRRNMTL